jgi:hypothetical protein
VQGAVAEPLEILVVSMVLLCWHDVPADQQLLHACMHRAVQCTLASSGYTALMIMYSAIMWHGLHVQCHVGIYACVAGLM